MQKKKIVLCYFSPEHIDYVPVDIGFVVAILEKSFPNRYNLEIVQLNYEIPSNVGNDIRVENVGIDVDMIRFHQPEAVFIFLENILWSKVFALGRASFIASELRKKQPDLFIGLQSHKMQEDQIQKALDETAIDCVIVGDIEKSFLKMDDILQQMAVSGVCYRSGVLTKNKKKACSKQSCCENDSNLDNIPSPYLNHVFDNYIQANQLRRRGDFRAFLISSRGCSFGCYYCFRSVKFEKVRYFSAKRFYDEMEYLFSSLGVYKFFVLDDAFLYSKQRLEDFDVEFQARLKSNPKLKNVEIFIMARPETIDEEVIKILSRLRVNYIQIGLQTVNPSLQHYMKRKVDVLYFKQIREWMRSYGISLHLDVVIGLPGDSAEWLKETMRYALLLEPHALQLKQFYLNPNTLFYNNKKEYNIEIEDVMRDFDAPYVMRADGINDAYFEETNSFIMDQIKAHPHIRWKYITNKKTFRSRDYKISNRH